MTLLKREKSAPGGASACTSQPWLKDILACVKRTLRCWRGGSIANEGSSPPWWSST